MEIIIDGLYINISEKNIHIHDSYKIKGSKSKKEILYKILSYDNRILKYRSFKSLLREGRSHNILYKLNIKRESTVHTDLEFNQKFKYKLGYLILNLLSFLD